MSDVALVSEPSNPFAGPGGPSPADLSRCVHCGLCLNACPTYTTLGIEMESPRGRIALIRAVQDGRIEMNETVEPHLNLCLQCRACEAVCPSGVPFGRIMEDARAALQPKRGARPANRLQTFMLRNVVGRQRVLAAFVALARLYRGVPLLGRVVRGLPLLPRRLRDAERMLPERVPAAFPRPGRTVVYRARGERRGRVAMLSGCVMSEMFGPTNRATARVLAENGFEVVIPGDQVCCGALHVHNGDRSGAQRLARRNLGAFLGRGFDALVVNSAGCGSTLKEYRQLLRDDDQPVVADAERLGAMTRDVSEFLAAAEVRPPAGRLDWRVTYQDSCHLAHAQRVTAPPRAVLRAIPGLHLHEMPASDRCCGAAGIYSLLEPEMSRALIDRKMDDIATVEADVIVTANPGCMLQLEGGVRSRGTGQRVMHVIDVLDAAYRAGGGAVGGSTGRAGTPQCDPVSAADIS